MGYVCAFRGRRDSYQVPVALAEADKLDMFITDHYRGRLERAFLPVLPARLAETVSSRYDDALPVERVRAMRMTAVCEAAARFTKIPAARIYDRFDPCYGEAAAREARRSKSDLMMYSAYAWEAFNAPYIHTPHKVLFQFHPHFELEDAILKQDRVASARDGIVFSGGLENFVAAPNTLRYRADSSWQVADQIVCASSFTRRSLVEAGASSERISVVPYGVTVDEQPAAVSLLPESRFQVLFVGSGLQRKGLHHLLRAWERARKPKGAQLTVVARVIDPGLAPLLEGAQGLRYLKGVSEPELQQLYRSATVFCMPSLVEGFGQVYLEALSQGLPVIGTTNTSLPDIGDETDGIFLTSPGDIDELIAMIERMSIYLDNNEIIRKAAIACARRYTWQTFRTKLRNEIR